MPNSILLYDALWSLNKGHLLRKAGGLSNGLYLEYVPEIALVFDRLQRDGYLRAVVFPDRNPDSIQFFALSEAGREKLHEVSRWYKQLPWYLKFWGRLGLPLSDSGQLVIRKRDTGADNVQIDECALGVHFQSRAIRLLTSFPAIVTSLSAGLGRIVMTRGVACLDADTVAQILDSVRTYYRFDEDIDP